MTEVTSRTFDFRTPADGGKKALSVRRYEAKPPENLELVDPDNLIATTKEEEWVTKKKVELTTKKQIETRVKRQVVLEDGKIVEDSGPIVTTNTTEDTEKQEHQQTEHRQLGDDGDGEKTKEVVVRISSLEGNPSLLKETREKKIKSREETEELVETEDVVHLGNISDKAYQEAVQSKRDIREALEEANHKLVHVNSTGPRVVHQSTKNRKVTDTEDTRHTREVQKDGKIVTETSKTTEHEEVNGVDEPDSVPLPPSAQKESLRESSHRYAKTKDQELVEYLADGRKIGEQMRYEAVNEEGDRLGDAEQLMMANAAGELVGWDSLSERVRKMRDRQQQQQQQQHPGAGGKTLADFDEEERTRKVETAKWLEHHFGSESTGRSSTGNLSEEDDDENDHQQQQQQQQQQRGRQKTTSNSFINVTMKSAETPANGYFKGVSEWKTAGGRDPTAVAPSAVRPPVRRKRDQRSATAVTVETAVGNGLHATGNGLHATGNGLHATGNELESSPLFNSVQQRVQGYEMTREKLSGRNAVDGHDNHALHRSSHHNGYGQSERTTPDRHSKSESPDPYRSWDHRRRRSADSNHRKTTAVAPEPKPDYSPEPERRASNGSAGGRSKKVYQKTRFAADARQAAAASASDPAANGKQERKKSFGESFRRLVGKFTGGSGGGGGNKADADRKKNKKKPETPERRRADSGDEYEYDYGDDDGGGGGGGNTYRSYGGTADHHYQDHDHGRRHGGEQRLFGSTQTLDRHRAGRTTSNGNNNNNNNNKARGRDYDHQHHHHHHHLGYDRDHRDDRDNRDNRDRRRADDECSDYGGDDDDPEAPPSSSGNETAAMSGRTAGAGVHRYYLGEDPFGGSIYGREREYDGGYKRRGSSNKKNDQQQQQHHHSSSAHHYVQRTIPVNTNSSTTLGRFSKSTGRLLADDYNSSVSDRAQTLPRKLRTESKIKKQVYASRENDYGGGQSAPLNGHRSAAAAAAGRNSGSMINVSFASNNNANNGGPAKPLRTFSRPSLLQSQHNNASPSLGRSHSFSVTDGLHHQHAQLQPRRSAGGGTASPLHRLDESPPPLKSPNIVSSVSRSTKDLQSVGVDDGYRSLSGSWASPGELPGYGGGGRNYAAAKDAGDPKKKMFMKGLLDHAPELYRTLNHQQDDGRRYSPVKDRPYSMSSSGHSSSSPTAVVRTQPEVHTNRSVTRRGSKDDYTETVRITSKSDDPYRPSVTNTVQNFTKKTVPRDGRVETIESTETKTVTKSRYSGGGGGGGDAITTKINGFNPAGGVVIEVRNGRN